MHVVQNTFINSFEFKFENSCLFCTVKPIFTSSRLSNIILGAQTLNYIKQFLSSRFNLNAGDYTF